MLLTTKKYCKAITDDNTERKQETCFVIYNQLNDISFQIMEFPKKHRL